MNDFNFKSSCRASVIYGDGNLDASGERATVHWNLQIDARDWGLKEATPFIDKILVTWIEECGDAETDKEMLISANEVGSCEIEWEIVHARSLTTDLTLFPEYVELDLSKKRVYIEFRA